MSNVRPLSGTTLLTLLVTALTVFGLTTAAAAVTAPAPVAAAQPVCGDTSGYELVQLADLPPEATDTVDLVAAGGPFPYPQDGTVFGNREDLLPDCAQGYYHEYTVETPGLPHRGARRIVTGSAGEHFYTADHYASFVLVDLDGAPGGCGAPSGLDQVSVAELPAEVGRTVALVRAGGPYPFPDDGQTYQNREGLLPDCAPGHYRLFTVPTPGVSGRGDRRLVSGESGEFHYTPDRYRTFVVVSGTADTNG